MTSSVVGLRDQIASIIDALSKAAVAEIAKAVEDGVLSLRLEVCQRDTEIKTLKSDIELLHGELRSARAAGNQGGEESQSDVADDGALIEKSHVDKDQSSLSEPEVQVKCEPVEEGGEETTGGQQPEQTAPCERDCKQWRPNMQTPTGCNRSDYSTVGQNSLLCLPEPSVDAGLAAPCGGTAGFQQGPFSRGLQAHSQYRNLYSTVRRRTVKWLMSKKGFMCSYCGKSFERVGHLERHKRIHTGEKPYRCEICGRRFNQKCSLKEHMKIHRRCLQPTPVEIQVDEQKQVLEVNPCPDAHRPGEEGQIKTEDDLTKSEDNLDASVHVKSEPVEEEITQPLLHGGTEQAVEPVGNLSESFSTFERGSQQWMSSLGQNNTEPSSTEYLGSSAHSKTPFQGITQLPPEASCSNFSSFPGKPYGEFKNNMISQTPCGSSDTLMISSVVSLHGMVGATPNDRQESTGRSSQVIKPMKCFGCSYCGKVFKRAGHLERHLRIHTGEKPYGCHVCGRCFNQKSSLKGHMKTHRNGENTDLLETSHLMFTMPDNEPLKNQVEPKAGLVVLGEFQLPGSTHSEPVGEQTLRLEPNREDFQTNDGAGTADQSQLWTSGLEKSGDATQQNFCTVLLQDLKYHLSPAAGAASEQQGYTSLRDLPFLDNKAKEEVMNNDQYSVMGIQSRGTETTELQDQHATRKASVNEYAAVSDRSHQVAAFEFDMTASGDRENNCGGDATRQNCFMCSTCRQNFDSFSLFQGHQCKNITEQSFSCQMCGRTFSQMSILKLHLKLHAEKSLF